MTKQEFTRFAAELRAEGKSDEEIVTLAREQRQGDQKGVLGKVYDRLTTPLTTKPSELAAAGADAIDQRSADDDAQIHIPGLHGLPVSKGALKGFAAGALEGAGNLASQLTSPLDLALSLVGGVGVAAGRRGMLGISKGARAVEAGLQAPLIAHGAGNVAQGVAEGDPTKAGMGLLEAAGGTLGARTAATHSFPVQKVSEAYNKSVGLPKPEPHTPVNVDPENAKRIADAYEAMPHQPDAPDVAASYKQLGKEIEDQFAFITERAGVKMEPWTQPGQPYANSTEMLADIKNNNRLFYFPTEQGYGTGGSVAQHPMLNVSERFGVPVNDLFRAVHDYFGHGRQGFQFGPKGEENAWLSHKATLTPEAHGALTSETRGQNSWVNFGRHLRRDDGSIPSKGEEGFVPPQARPFADQKAGLLPQEFVTGQAAPQSAPATLPAGPHGALPDVPAVQPMAGNVPPEFHAVLPQAAPPVQGARLPEGAGELPVLTGRTSGAKQKEALDAHRAQAARANEGVPAPALRGSRQPSVESGPGANTGDASLQGSTPEELLEFEHRSNIGGLAELDPNFYGKGQAGREASRKQADPANWVDRSYGTVKGGKVEARFERSPHVYEGAVPKSSVYDLGADPDGIIASLKGQYAGADLLTRAEKAVRDKGFKGYRVSTHENPAMRDTVVLFEKTPVKARAGQGNAASTALAVAAPAPAGRYQAQYRDPTTEELVTHPQLFDTYDEAFTFAQSKNRNWNWVRKIDGEPAPSKGGAAASTTFAVAAPAVAMAIPDDPESKWDDYGRIGVALAGAAGLGAAIRGRGAPVLTPQVEAAHRGAAALWLGGPKTAKAAMGEHASPTTLAAAQKILDRQISKAVNELPNTKKLLGMIRAGGADATWYNKTGEELRKTFGQDAELVARLIAATSNNATVAANAALALKALYQHKAGLPFTGFMKTLIPNIEKAVGGEVMGRKVDNFVKAMMGDENAVVVDKWMMRAFGYKGDAPTDAQYEFIEAAVKQLAAKEGITPREAQAAIWFAVKNKKEKGKNRPPSPPMEIALRDSIERRHADALKENRRFDKNRAKSTKPLF